MSTTMCASALRAVPVLLALAVLPAMAAAETAADAVAGNGEPTATAGGTVLIVAAVAAWMAVLALLAFQLRRQQGLAARLEALEKAAAERGEATLEDSPSSG